VQAIWVGHSDSQNTAHLQRLIDSLAARTAPGEILLIGDIRYTGSLQPTCTTTIRRFKDQKQFAEKIHVVFVANGVDLVSDRAEYLRERWELAAITREQIDSWLAQFDEAGQFAWIGRGVLRALRCLSTPEILGYLGIEDTAEFEKVFYYDSGEPGSSMPLAHAVAKKMPNLSVVKFNKKDLRELSGSSLLIEDCSISGSEFDSFMNKNWPSSVESPDEWRLVRIRLRYAVLSNGAEQRIKAELVRRNLHNIELDTRYSMRLDTVTRSGLEALKNGSFYCPTEGHALHTAQHVIEQAFVDSLVWGGIQKAKSARKFLQQIGQQLYISDMETRKVKPRAKGSIWLKQAGLGAGGLALTIALARSVPKSTLPVVWAGGKVKFRGKEIHWHPLLASS